MLTDAMARALEMLEEADLLWGAWVKMVPLSYDDRMALERLGFVGVYRGVSRYAVQSTPAGRAALAEWREAHEDNTR